MSIEIRLNKLRFLAQEIELAAVIARAQPTDFLRRALARRVLIRARDFIAHARLLRKPATHAGYDMKAFHERKEAYATAFDEYFKTLRDKAGAHVQDIEILERLELWSDIEVTKLGYFVDGARELYVEGLGPLGFPGYQPVESFPETSDPAFAKALALHAAATSPGRGVAMGVDAFAATRSNRLIALNQTPVHQRAGQLVSLAEWIDAEASLFGRVTRWPNAIRVIRAQVVTDVVSFSDCLITRADAGAKQQMLGLDDLLREGGDPAPIDDFRKVFRFRDKLGRLRSVRDRVGAHLEEDDAVALVQVLQELDGLPMIEVMRFYGKVRAVFRLACQGTIYLGQYLLNGARVSGVVAVDGGIENVKPFDPASSEAAKQMWSAPSGYSAEDLANGMDAWCRGDADAEEARTYLWNAFSASAVVERRHGDGRVVEHRELHRLLFKRLVTCPEERRHLLRLIWSCKTGFPEPLADILLDLHDRLHVEGDRSADLEIYSVLGALPLRRNERALQALTAAAGIADPRTAHVAIAAFYRLVIHAARRGEDSTADVFNGQVLGLIEGRPERERLVACFELGSLFLANLTYSNNDVFRRETKQIQEAIRRYLGDGPRDVTVDALLSQCDYVTLAVLFSERFQVDGRLEESCALLEAVADEEIHLPTQVQLQPGPLVNFALALQRVGRADYAKQVARETMVRYPALVDLRLVCLRVLAEAGVPKEVCRDMLAYIRESYVLTDEDAKGADVLADLLAVGAGVHAEGVAAASP